MKLWAIIEPSSCESSDGLDGDGSGTISFYSQKPILLGTGKCNKGYNHQTIDFSDKGNLFKIGMEDDEPTYILIKQLLKQRLDHMDSLSYLDCVVELDIKINIMDTPEWVSKNRKPHE